MLGTVKWFDAVKGCGFILVADHPDVFVGTRENPGLSLSVGYAVEFDVVKRRGQYQALRVKVLNDPELIKPMPQQTSLIRASELPDWRYEVYRSLDMSDLSEEAQKILEGYFIVKTRRGIEVTDCDELLIFARSVADLSRKAIARMKSATVRFVEEC